MLTAAGRRARLAAVLVVALLLGYGTAFGSDDHFPTGPFSMFSRRVSPDGVVRAAMFRGRLEGGEDRRIGVALFGLRRAEIEGQVERFVADPALMGELAEAWRRHNPDAAPIVEIRLIHRIYELRDGKRVSDYERVLATWTRP